MNVISITGRLGGDPETKQFGDNAVTELRVAVTERLKKDGQWTEATHWHTAKIWNNRLASDYLQKGNLISVTGRSTFETWQDAEGNNRSKHVIKAFDVENLSPKGEATATKGAAEPAADNLPF